MICIEFTAQVESDLDLISSGQSDFHSIIKKVYDAFYPIIQSQMSIKRTSTNKNAIFIGDIEIKKGKYGEYFTLNSKNYGLSNYMKMSKKKVKQLTEEDITNHKS